MIETQKTLRETARTTKTEQNGTVTETDGEIKSGKSFPARAQDQEHLMGDMEEGRAHLQ